MATPGYYKLNSSGSFLITGDGYAKQCDCCGDDFDPSDYSLCTIAYSMETSSGDTVIDVSGNSNDGTMQYDSFPPGYVDGTIAGGSSALVFNNEYHNRILLPDVFNYLTGGSSPGYEITIAFWFQTDTAAVLLGMTAYDSGGWVPSIYLGSSGFIHSSVFWHNGGSNQTTSTTYCNDNAPHHVCVTYKNGTEKLYIDGVLEDTLTSVDQYAYSSSYLYYIGWGLISAWGDISNDYYVGTLDEFRVYYNRALTATQVAALAGY